MRSELSNLTDFFLTVIIAGFFQGCVVMLSLAWIVCLTVFGFLVLPKGMISKISKTFNYSAKVITFLHSCRILLQYNRSAGVWTILQSSLFSHSCHLCPLFSHHNGAHVLLRIQLPRESTETNSGLHKISTRNTAATNKRHHHHRKGESWALLLLLKF